MADLNQNPMARLEATNLDYSLSRRANDYQGFDYGCAILGPSWEEPREIASAAAGTLADATEGALAAYRIYDNYLQAARRCLGWVVQVVKGERSSQLGCLVRFHGVTAECLLLKPDGTAGDVITEPCDNLLFYHSQSVTAGPNGLTVMHQFPVDVRYVRACTFESRGGDVDEGVLRRAAVIRPPEALLDKTLEQLDGERWGEPNYDSYVVINCHRLRHVPLKDFTTEDLRLMIGQSLSLAYLVPLALAHLERDPMASGDLYEGDLFESVARVPSSFWRTSPELQQRWQAVLRGKPDE